MTYKTKWHKQLKQNLKDLVIRSVEHLTKFTDRGRGSGIEARSEFWRGRGSGIEARSEFDGVGDRE